MVRQLNSRGGRVAGLLIVIALGGLLWHVLACVESPMSFSPDGKDLAFVTMEPYELTGISVAGPHAYRLMVLKGGKDLQVVEQSVDSMLSAPAYRRDGEVFCYLRIPLLDCNQGDKLDRLVTAQKEQVSLFQKATSRPAGLEYQPEQIAQQSRPAPASRPARPRPVIGRVMDDYKALMMRASAGLELKATLVERNARTLEVVSATPVSLFAMLDSHDGPDDCAWSYLMTRPQYSPDGKTVCFCAMSIVYAATPAEGDFDVLGGPAIVAALSPDGSKIAAIDDVNSHAITLVATNGSSIEHQRTDGKVLIGGFGWADDQSLAMLCGVKTDGDPNTHLAFRIMRINGEVVSTQGLPEPSGKKGETEFARSSDGKHMVVCCGPIVLFLNAKGEQIGEWKAEEKSGDGLAQPTFTPDGKLVAFKHMRDDDKRADAIVFFTPEGKQAASVAIPAIKSGTTRPASMPATAAAQTAPAE